MKHIFSIIMELGLPTGTIAFWGTLVPRILTVDHTFNINLILVMPLGWHYNLSNGSTALRPCIF